jgi:uncharacterized protein
MGLGLRPAARALAALACLAFGVSAQIAQGLPRVGEEAGAFLDGRWEGRIDLGGGEEELDLRLFPSDPETGAEAGGLIDMPGRSLFGYPMEKVERRAWGLSFTFMGGAPFAGSLELRGVPEPVASGESYAISGSAQLTPAGARLASTGSAASAGATTGVASGGGGSGKFRLSYAGEDSRGAAFGTSYYIDTGRGLLPGSLLLPEEAPFAAVPLVLIVAGAGADRDGDNYSVPGRSDALAELAQALRGLGVATLRYDRRGAGEAYRLGPEDSPGLFDDQVADARAAIAALAADPRFSRLVVLGHAEGALVAAAALAPGAAGEGPVSRADGLAALCASGKTELETIEEALSSVPAERKPEAEAIMAALKAGGLYPDPSPYFADYFRPSLQPYLASTYRFDIRSLFAAAPCPALVVAGGSDLQVDIAETGLLAAARPDAAYRVIRGMSHPLKATWEDEDANYDSFTDPRYPLGEGLAELIAAFAKGEALPGRDPRSAQMGTGGDEAAKAGGLSPPSGP